MLAVSSLLTAGASRTADRPAARPAKRAAAARWRGVDGGRGPGRRGVRHAGQHAGAFAGAPLPSLCRRVSSVSARGLLDRLFGGGAEAASDEAAEEEAELVAAEDLPFPADLLDDTFLQGRDLAMAYCASRDGFDARVFHNKVDQKGPCVVYAETEVGVRFGGFNSEGFSSSDDYAASFAAFLYCWPGSGEECVKLGKVGGPEAAVFDYARGGPQWGADALIIGPPQAPVMGGMSGPDSPTGGGAGNLRTAKSRLGQAYEMVPEEYGDRSLFGGTATEAKLREVQVFFAPEIAKLY